MFRIREITYAKNCVFHCVHKEIDNAFSPGDNYSFHESDLQITLRLLSSSLGNTVLLHTLFLEYETQIGHKKKLDNVFQSNCSSHAELLTNLRKIEKRPKIRHKAVLHPALQLARSTEPKPHILWSLRPVGYLIGEINSEICSNGKLITSILHFTSHFYNFPIYVQILSCNKNM